MPAATADVDWQLLDATIKNKPRHPGIPDTTWATVAEKARQFQEKYPKDTRVAQSRKLEVTALLKASAGLQVTEAEVAKKVKSYLADGSVPASDRFDVSALAKETELVRKPQKRKQGDMAQVREKHARELLAEFPQEPRAYGYLLGAGNAQEGSARLKIAREILNSGAPEQIKATARRTLARQDLVGKDFSLAGLDLKKYKGTPLVVYTWTKERPDILKAVRVWAKAPGIAFVGVNLDDDPATGKLMVGNIKPPGDQLYLGGGMQGAAARQLQATAVGSVYLIDRKGVLIDVDGNREPLEKMGRLGKKEDKS